MNLYEGMFLLDNQAVRADWRNAKSTVTGLLEKHGGKVTTARRWDERKLAYPIRGRQRGTYMLAYYELDVGGIDGLRRDLELSENVLRYILLRAEEVPEGEDALHAAELEAGFEVPVPPEDDEPAEESTAAEEEQAEQPKASAKGAEGAAEGAAAAGGEETKAESAAQAEEE